LALNFKELENIAIVRGAFEENTGDGQKSGTWAENKNALQSNRNAPDIFPHS